jgi:hypothetical protein
MSKKIRLKPQTNKKIETVMTFSLKNVPIYLNERIKNEIALYKI